MRRVVAAVLISSLVAPVAAQPAPAPSPVEIKVDEATEYFRVGNFEAALAAFREAYALEARPDFLYAMATIEEQRGGCAAAIELYQQFLDTDPPPPPDDVTAVTAAIEACKDKLGIEDQAKQPPEEPIEKEPPPAPRITTPRPWYTDTLGLVLTGSGVLALGTGGVVYGLARGDLSDAEEPGIAADEYTRRWDAAKSKQTVAFVSAGLGGALVIAGVLHLVLADHGTTSSEARLSITPGAGDIGLGLAGHF